MASTLSNEGIQTIVLFPENDSEEFKNKLESANVEYIQTSLHRLTKEKKSLLMYVLTFIPELLKIISIVKKKNIDIVLCNGSWQVKGVLASKFTKAKSIWIQNDSYQPRAVRSLFKLVSRFSDAYVFVSSKTKDFYQSINPSIEAKPNVVIQSPVDLDKFKPSKKVNILSEAEFKVLTVGYVNPNKGFDTFIRSIAEVNKQSDKKVQFYIAGPVFDSQQGYYKKLKDTQLKCGVENMEFLGYRNDIQELLHSVDLYVCSSDFEASPISIWEAMGAGIPVVTTDVGDVREIIQSNAAGIVVDTKDHIQLGSAITEMIADSELRNRYATQGRKIAEQIFSVESVSQQYKSFYQKINES